ncbi:TRAP transporter small permease [Nitratireductor mangrovi]|uniref:TRAP transporter small permease protein n=1 Tax=Nitratireductor mangrovi TaxID=2599600 RepID=A0A5B8KU88_9HYPH|nr:TRAP transporter small permease [Nitratireductor mangrovi]QDY99119.1 TRAP transporter small permease [Nitratireductor mangrovi]
MRTLSVFINALARFLAIIGGIVLAAITVLTVVSITGRSLVPFGLAPVPGDFELVEAGTAFAVFAFLPWCQLNRGHATVDLFTSYLPESTNRWIDLVSEILMTVILILLAVRLWYGMMDKIRYGETTFILQFPVWWGFAVAMVGAVVAVIVSVYMVVVRVKEVREGRTLLAPTLGGGH